MLFCRAALRALTVSAQCALLRPCRSNLSDLSPELYPENEKCIFSFKEKQKASRNWLYKRSSPQNKNHLLTLMSFETHSTVFLLRNIK